MIYLKIININDNLRCASMNGKEYKLHINDVIVIDDRYKYKHILRNNKIIMPTKTGFIRFITDLSGSYNFQFNIPILTYRKYAIDVSISYERNDKINKLLEE